MKNSSLLVGKVQLLMAKEQTMAIAVSHIVTFQNEQEKSREISPTTMAHVLDFVTMQKTLES